MACLSTVHISSTVIEFGAKFDRANALRGNCVSVSTIHYRPAPHRQTDRRGALINDSQPFAHSLTLHTHTHARVHKTHSQ